MGVFKSYDIRGVYPTELDADLARKIGVSLGKHYRTLPVNAGKSSLHLVVGRDMRQSAPEMAAALIEGLLDEGHNVTDIGMVTTPCCYFAIQRLSADGGIMCTASHNPPQYIGFKITREEAIPISFDTGLNMVQQRLGEPPTARYRGSLNKASLDHEYLEFIAGMARKLKPIRVAADCSNGMAGKYINKLFDQLPCELTAIYTEPDGTFPNHEADPLKEENLRDLIALVKETRAAVGFCFDGDADRVAVVDEKGDPVGCDLITALLAMDALESNPGRPITYDLRSSKVVADIIAQHGGQPIRSRVGHSHVKQSMREIGAVAGGELSGHYYFQLRDRVTYFADSALVACIRLLNVLSSSGKTMSELLAPMRKYHHTGEINFSIDDKEAALATVQKTFPDGRQDTLDGVSVQYDDWWVNVRPSNTEPLLRLTLEGNTPELRQEKLAVVEGILSKFGHRAQSSH